ncbi:MAG: 2-oxo acid dehydrogenase subunit E2 [Bacteroidales bacterium]|nr:2-oxo acid dehydrogenase subunit E2 [Bacteroidales bacterium]
MKEIQYPSSRRFTFDVGRIGREKHHVKALLEVDISEARSKIKQYRRSGNKMSFTAWLIKVIVDCVALHPPINGINRQRGNRVVVFSEVDISLVIEKEVKGTRVPLPYVIRKADQKTHDQIYSEIESAKSQIIEDEGDYVLGEKHNSLGMRFFAGLPQGLRLTLMRIFLFNNPQRLKDKMGTVMVTTAGMAGHTRGWIIPFSMHPLSLSFGSLNEQPPVHSGEIRIREILHLTILVDHDVIDGIPAAKFVDDLVKKMERGYGL